MLKNPKAKGSRVEREIRSIFEQAGYKVVRSAGSLGKADLYIHRIGSIQVKARKNISLYKLFEGADFLIIKANYKEPLVVMDIKKFLKLLRGAGDGNSDNPFNERD
jgi:Holliday junction resolvase